MTAEQFMDGLRQNIARINAYQLGMDGTGGLCDCIGLIIGAIRLAGGEWAGTHGSNYAARNEMRGLEKITSERQLRTGEMVFKARMPGEENYSLPDAYSRDADQNDYYHVGVVTSVQPLEITHCTSVAGGIRRDAVLGKWQYAGSWKGITDAVPEGMPFRVTGGRLKMREGPGTQYAVLCTIPDGTLVAGSELPAQGEWRAVSYKGENGFVMARYLEPVPGTTEQLRRLLSLLQEVQQAVETMLSQTKT